MRRSKREQWLEEKKRESSGWRRRRKRKQWLEKKTKERAVVG